MKLNRRNFVKTGVAVAAIAAAPARAWLPLSLTIYDSRLSASRALARRNGGTAIDLAKEDSILWRQLRGDIPAGRVVCLSRWSESVLVRGLLEEKGKRVRHLKREGDLFRLEMA